MIKLCCDTSALETAARSAERVAKSSMRQDRHMAQERDPGRSMSLNNAVVGGTTSLREVQDSEGRLSMPRSHALDVCVDDSAVP